MEKMSPREIKYLASEYRCQCRILPQMASPENLHFHHKSTVPWGGQIWKLTTGSDTQCCSSLSDFWCTWILWVRFPSQGHKHHSSFHSGYGFLLGSSLNMSSISTLMTEVDSIDPTRKTHVSYRCLSSLWTALQRPILWLRVFMEVTAISWLHQIVQ